MKIWSNFWYLVCSFCSILKWIFCTFFPRVLPTTLFNFYWVKMDPENHFFIRYTLEENKINESFKIEKSYIPNIKKSIKFSCFWLIWWCLVYSFFLILKLYLSYFFQGYGNGTPKIFWETLLVYVWCFIKQINAHLCSWVPFTS